MPHPVVNQELADFGKGPAELPSTLTATAETVLAKRYYKPGENFAGLCRRVAKAVSQGVIGTEEDKVAAEEEYFELMYSLKFLPNSPTLMNAGTDIGQLSACFVLPVGDSMHEIFQAVHDAALIFQSGGGVGYSFSDIRPSGALVKSTQGVASGPLSFMKVFNEMTETIKAGGCRRGASMGVLTCSHPDILDFVKAKDTEGVLANFNISVGITHEFMEAVKSKGMYPLVTPKDGSVVKMQEASEIWGEIIDHAWKNGEPGVLFLDTANDMNPTPHLGRLESSNPCGEQILYPHEACVLGSLNLGLYMAIRADGCPVIDGVALEKDIRTATRFLDAVIDVNKYPIPQIDEKTKLTRKIGLGIMGAHDMLIQLGLPYDSEEGRSTLADVMDFVNTVSMDESVKLADKYGPYPGFMDGVSPYRRNAATTTIAPTGTLSMLADCSSGCEPYFAIVVEKIVLDDTKFFMVNKHFERIAREEGWFSEELLAKVAESGTVMGHPEIPETWQQVFKTAQDIAPEDHIKMQAELQKYVHAAISKTVNMPNSATKEDVANAYLLAYDLGCKGLTVYRDGSREVQVLHAGSKKPDQAPITSDVVPYLVKRDLLEVEDAKRHKVMWKGTKMYTIVSIDENEKPIEVFTKLPKEAGINGSGVYSEPMYQEHASNWDALCRAISLGLRYGISVEEYIEQMDKASYTMVDAPGTIARVLRKYEASDLSDFSADEVITQSLGDECPDCGEMTYIHEGGCTKCLLCGYSECK